MNSTLSLTDRAELADLVSTYALVADTREFDRFTDVFVADAVLHTGRGERQGLTEICAAMEGLRRYEATTHVLGQHLFAPSDGTDEATGITYCEAHHLTVDGPTRTDMVMHIHYHDKFLRTAAGWRIAERRLDVAWTDDRPVN